MEAEVQPLLTSQLSTGRTAQGGLSRQRELRCFHQIRVFNLV